MQTRAEEFLVESREQIGILEQGLLSLERLPDGPPVRREVDRCFRAIHSIKGDAGLLGYTAIHRLAHVIENILETLRQSEQRPDAKTVEALLAGVDRLLALLDDLDHQAEADLTPILERLALLNTPAPDAAGDNEVASGTSRSCYLLDVDLVDHAKRTGLDLLATFEKLTAAGTIENPRLDIPIAGMNEPLPSGPIRYRADFTTARPIEPLRQALGISESELIPLPKRESPPIASTPLTAARPAASTTPATGTAPIPAREAPAASIRVHVSLLERLMTLAGELTLVRNQALRTVRAEEPTERSVLQRLSAVTTELQGTVLRTRMQPVVNLFNKFPRLIRDLARQLGKEVDVVLEGTEVELDRTILEQLSDPLTHLVRNCVDHGLETPAERQSRGKPSMGTVRLAASHDDGQVIIQIQDDGRGIDPEKIRAKARERGIRTPAELERMTPREVLSLILLPGFSTAETVSDISGRGVGMDVVQTNLERMEGSLSIDSVVGAGTTMTLRLPLTLAIIPSLIVRVNGERYAIPQRDLEEVVGLFASGPQRIERAHDREVFRLRNRLLPVARLAEIFADPVPWTTHRRLEWLEKRSTNQMEGGVAYLAVVRDGRRRLGLVLDAIEGMEEIVVKPMQSTMRAIPIFRGATILGDGAVGLILDIEGIADHAGIESDPEKALARPTTSTLLSETQDLLVFSYGPMERFAVPISQVRRVAMVSADQFDVVAGREYVTLDGVTTRVCRLERLLPVSAPDETSGSYFLILPHDPALPHGVLARAIVDTRSLEVTLERGGPQLPGLLGSTILDHHLTLIVDMNWIAAQVAAESRAASVIDGPRAVPVAPAAPAAPVGPKAARILVVDDTQFFREVIASYLSSAGYVVETSEHGQAGLDRLARDDFDLVVSDIEMPVMDGWRLASECRARGYRMPMLALTSLAGDEFRHRALAAGFNDFQTKLDKDALLETVARLLREVRL